MMRPFRFAVISDPHVALPHTVWDIPNRFHLVEVSIPSLEQILQKLASQDLDFLLMPGDLTQHGERENHEWLVQRLQQLPFPAYVVPGNHDVIVRDGCDRTLSLSEFPKLYAPFGYRENVPYYHQEVLPGVHLLGLNSIAFDEAGQQIPVGYMEEEQLAWVSAQLEKLAGQWVMVMIHHNVLEHLPGQAKHPMGQRYILKNRDALMRKLQAAGVQLIFTGHLHVQDIAQTAGLWEITTGSLVSYPHPYRIVTATPQPSGHLQLQIETYRVTTVADWPDLQGSSLKWASDRAIPFMVKFLTCPPFHLPIAEAERYAPELRDFWITISAGDADFNYPQLPEELNQRLRQFGAVDPQGNHRPIDNNTQLLLPLGDVRVNAMTSPN
ncbi:MAG: metallophosphoesterase [Cyanobacteria bacterium P01_H01_bin.58]